MSGFGERLRSLRRRKQWTQKDLAGASGLSAGYIGLLEINNRRPERDKLADLCRALELDSEETDEIFLAAGYGPVSDEAQQAVRDSIEGRRKAASTKVPVATTLSTATAATSLSPSSISPEVLEPIGPLVTADNRFHVTILRDATREKSVLLIRDRTGEAEGCLLSIRSKSDDGVFAEGRVSDGYLAVLIDAQTSLSFDWVIEIHSE